MRSKNLVVFVAIINFSPNMNNVKECGNVFNY